MTKGILIIGAGHRNYGKMAVALAASIRMVDKDVNICLAYTDSAITHLTDEELSLFTDRVKIPKKYYTLGANKQAFIKIKVFMDKLSPYDETLFLDADQVWLWKDTPTNVMAQLEQHDFVMENSGYIGFDNYIYPASENWCDMKEVQEGYGFTDERFYKVHSEFVWFKRTEDISTFFDVVRENYSNPKVKPKEFAGAYPDEFAFAIAISQLKRYPIDNYTPTFWYPREKKDVHLHQIADTYKTLSIGGSFVDDASKKNYNAVAIRAYNELGLKAKPYQITARMDKRYFLPERTKE